MTPLTFLPKRFNRFELSLHPEKTKLIAFGKPKKDTFDFTGKDQIDSIRKTKEGYVRFYRIYLLLGEDPQRLLGDKETNSTETAKPFSADVVKLVQEEST